MSKTQETIVYNMEIKTDMDKKLSIIEKEMRDLNKEQEKLSKSGKKNEKQFKDNSKEIDKLDKEYTSLNKTTKTTNANSSQLSEGLDNVGGSLGGVIQGFKAFSTALMANPILAIAAAVTALVTALYAYSKASLQAAKDTTKIARSFSVTRQEARLLRVELNVIASVFEVDFNETVKASSTFMRTFGIDGKEALDLIKEGFEKGADVNGEFLSILKEYPAQLKTVGLNAKETIAIITQTEQMGLFSDKGIDSIKEAGIRLREMTKSTKDAINGIGLSADQLQQDIENGNKSLFDVMQLVSDQMKTLPENSSAVGAAIADIFGGAGEDAGAEFLTNLGGINLELDELPSNLSESEIETNKLTEAWSRFTDKLLATGGALDIIMSKTRKTNKIYLDNWTAILESDLNAFEKLEGFINPWYAMQIRYNMVMAKSRSSMTDLIDVWNDSTFTLDKQKETLKELNYVWEGLIDVIAMDGKTTDIETKALKRVTDAYEMLTKRIQQQEAAIKKANDAKKISELIRDSKKLIDVENELADSINNNTASIIKNIKDRSTGFKEYVKNILSEYNYFIKHISDDNINSIVELSDKTKSSLNSIEEEYDKDVQYLKNVLSKQKGLRGAALNDINTYTQKYKDALAGLETGEVNKSITIEQANNYYAVIKSNLDKIKASRGVVADYTKTIDTFTKSLLNMTKDASNSQAKLNELFLKSSKEITDTQLKRISKTIITEKEYYDKLKELTKSELDEKTTILETQYEAEREIVIKNRTDSLKDFKGSRVERYDLTQYYYNKILELRDIHNDKLKRYNDGYNKYIIEETKYMLQQTYNLKRENNIMEQRDLFSKLKFKIDSLNAEEIAEIKAIRASEVNQKAKEAYILQIQIKYEQMRISAKQKFNEEAFAIGSEYMNAAIGIINELSSAELEAALLVKDEKLRIAEETAATRLRISEDEYAKESSELNLSLKRGTISQAKYNTKMEELAIEKARKDKSAKNQQIADENAAGAAAFKAEQKARLSDVAMNSASAILAAWNTTIPAPYGQILAGIQSAFIGGMALDKASTINSQEFAPKPLMAASGGLLKGQSHANGGIAIGDIEGEGFESIINAASTKKYAPVLSAINEAGNGNKNYDAVDSIFNTDELANKLGKVINDKKVYVTSKDMTLRQDDDASIVKVTSF